MTEEFDIWRLLAGLGIFLFGMFLLEESVRNLAGRSFKRFIRRYTTGRIKAVLSGSLVTALLQSSSAVSLMVLAFVGAGIMAMENAIGVMLGSNVGTTATSWIVASLGFQVSVEAFALPLIGIGGLGIIFLGKSLRYSNISKLLVGFGFLFMGLDYMKSSVEHLAEAFEIAALPDYGILLYLLAGVVLTALMQSSSATIAVVLTSLHAGLIDFETAGAMVIGANIGTTITVFFGAIGGNQIKKRVATSHLVFNLVTGILGMALLFPLCALIQWLTGPAPENEVLGIAIFHTAFNVLGVLLFLPFIGRVSRLLVRLVPDKRPGLTVAIHALTPNVVEAAVEGVHTEVKHFIRQVMAHNLSVLQIDPQLVFGVPGNPQHGPQVAREQQYKHLKTLQAEIFTFAAHIQENTLSETESADLHRYLHSARQALHAAKTLKDVAHNLEAFENADHAFLNHAYAGFRKRMVACYLQVAGLGVELPVATAMARILHHIRVEDQEFVPAAMRAVMEGQLADTDISDLLLVNRAFIQSARQVVAALRGVMLTAQEEALFEELTDPSIVEAPEV